MHLQVKNFVLKSTIKYSYKLVTFMKNTSIFQFIHNYLFNKQAIINKIQESTINNYTIRSRAL